MRRHFALILLLACVSLLAHDARVQVTNGVPQILLDGQAVRPRWTYNRTQQGIFGPLDQIPHASSYLMAEPTRRQFLFTAETDTDAEVTIHFKLNEYNLSKPELNWWVDDLALEDLTDGTAPLPLVTFDTPEENIISFFPQDQPDYQLQWSPQGGRDGSPAVKLTWRNIVAMQTDALPYHAYTIPRKMLLKAGHDYRLSFWSNADATARLSIFVKALPDYHDCLSEKYDVMQDTLLLAKEAAVDFVSTCFDSPWPRPGEEEDWVVVDTTLGHILQVMPDAKIVPRFEVKAPQWWHEAHPDDMFGFAPDAHFPHRPVESFCSPLWRQEAKERIRKLVMHIEEKFGANIVGYHPCPSFCEEWFWEGAIDSPDRGGYGLCEVFAWREWLARKYQTDEALQAAWGTSDVTLATASVPPPERYVNCLTDGIFLLPSANRDLIDHNDFLSDAMADVLLEFAHTIRELCGQTRLTVAFYGYSLETAPNFHQPAIGHDCLAKVLASPDLDILCAPVSYWGRLEGGGGYQMAPVESVLRAGKMWFMEDDDRTHLAISGSTGGLGNHDYAQSRWGAQNILLRNLGQQLVRNLGSWWMDLGSFRWFEDPALWEMMQRIQPADQWKLEKPTPFLPQVAVFVDERAYSYSTAAVFIPGEAGHPDRWLNHPAPTQAPLISASRQPLARLGTSVGHYLLTDQLAETPPHAQLAIYLNAWALTATERARLKERAARQFALWCFAPGYVDPECGLSPAQVEELTGFKVTPLHGTFQRVMGTPEGKAIGLPDEWLVDGEVPMAMAVATQPGDTVLARWPSGENAIVLRDNAIYNATTTLPWSLLRKAAQTAGVHLYTDQECIFYTDDERFAVLHGIRDDTITFTLPAPADAIYDATTMTLLVEHTDTLAVPLKFGETRILFWK
ncbi:MAG: beta-galactosidase [Victivallales bacterium]|nr:beta-galactosidase [Victivallales bacterium]